MKDEIKEILDKLKIKSDRYSYYLKYNTSYENKDEDYEAHLLLDCINNLQKERNMFKDSFETMSKNYFEEKSRNEKANTLLDELLERAYIDGEYIMYDYSTSELLEVKQALEGEDKDVNITN